MNFIARAIVMPASGACRAGDGFSPEKEKGGGLVQFPAATHRLPSRTRSLVDAYPLHFRSAVTVTGTPLVMESKTGESFGADSISSLSCSSEAFVLILNFIWMLS